MSKYTFKPYRMIVPQLFEKKERIRLHVKKILKIDYIGSTSIPDLGGKGIVDIAIATKKEDMEDACKKLQELGYEFRPSFSTAELTLFCDGSARSRIEEKKVSRSFDLSRKLRLEGVYRIQRLPTHTSRDSPRIC